MKSAHLEPSSFRDPAGFVFHRDGQPYRAVTGQYADVYDRLDRKGLYRDLQSRGLLVPHVEIPPEETDFPDAPKVLRPERIPFVSYPYEWSFHQLKDAALLTLATQKAALDFGASLKDASAYNVQFLRGRPILIDTLSFEDYREGSPWRAYRQFCEHFLAPLSLSGSRDPRLARLSALFIDGVPLDLAAKLTPVGTRLKPGMAMHLHLHAKAQRAFESKAAETGRTRVSLLGLRGLLDSLEGTIRGIEWQPAKSAWSDYYATQGYGDEALEAKRRIVERFLSKVHPRPGLVWDLGANTGYFSRLAEDLGAFTVAWDMDALTVDRHYIALRGRGAERTLPLVQDFTNPSAGIGWANRERPSLQERASADAILALALIHHLAIGNNVPLPRIAEWLASLGEWLVIEFVPKSDPQARTLLTSREDVFESYDVEEFERAFGARFGIQGKAAVPGTERVLYLMRRNGRP